MACNQESGVSAAESVVDEIRADGGEAVAAVETVVEWESAHRIVQMALDQFSRIDCVVNNAGVVRDRFVFDMSREEWQTVMDVHLNGSLYLTRTAAPHFKAQEPYATTGVFGPMPPQHFFLSRPDRSPAAAAA